MRSCQMVHVEATDTVSFSDPSASNSGCLKIRTARADDLYIFLPADLAEAEVFLTALIDQATTLLDSVAIALHVQRGEPVEV